LVKVDGGETERWALPPLGREVAWEGEWGRRDVRDGTDRAEICERDEANKWRAAADQGAVRKRGRRDERIRLLTRCFYPTRPCRRPRPANQPPKPEASR
jgi:hypothetical protein